MATLPAAERIVSRRFDQDDAHTIPPLAIRTI